MSKQTIYISITGSLLKSFSYEVNDVPFLTSIRIANIIFLAIAFRHPSDGNITPQNKEFEAPLLAALPETVNGLSLQNIYMKLLNPFRLSKEASSLDDCTGSTGDSIDLMDAMHSDSDSSFQKIQLKDDPESSNCRTNECEITRAAGELYDGTAVDSNKEANVEDFEFYLKNERVDVQQQKIEINELDLLETVPSRLHVNVHWQQNASRQYDTSMLNNLPEVHKLELITKGIEDSVALHGCLEAFLKEEPLGPEDMW